MGQADQRVLDDRYQVSPRTLCFVTDGGDVLLLRRSGDERIWPGQYNGVGGHVQSDEDVRTAARREIWEETGLQARDLRLRGVVNIPVGADRKGVMLFVFTAKATTREFRPSEAGALAWTPRDRLEEVDLVEDLPTLLPRVLAMGCDEPPFFALYTYDEDDRFVVSFSSRRGQQRE